MMNKRIMDLGKTDYETLSGDYQVKMTGTRTCRQALSPDCKVKISVPKTRPVIYVPFTAICG